MLSIAETLGKAREYLEKKGWVRGQLNDDNGRLCSYGAILYVLDGLDEYQNIDGVVETNLVPPVAEFLNVHGIGMQPYTPSESLSATHPIHRLVTWNDTQGRTEQEVLDAFAKAEKVALAGFDPDAA